MIEFATKRFVIPGYLLEEDTTKKDKVLDELQDLSTFISSSLQLVNAKRLEGAKEALMQAAIKVESIATTIRGGE